MSDRSEIIITPSPEQYKRLLRDLEALRRHGFESNTAAILAAVHRAANGYSEGPQKTPRQRGSAPGPEPRS